MITLPIGLVMRILDLLRDIERMKPGFEVYETATQITKDLIIELENQFRR